ncbi:MAG: phage holin [Lachnospiraceae bacterium]
MKNISAGTAARTAVLLLALLNNALAIAGKSPLPIENEAVTGMVSFLFTTGAAFVAWWKNNSFTQEAIEADWYMKDLKGK